MREFCKWKASTAKLLISRLEDPSDKRRIPADPDCVDAMTQRILSVLKPLMTSRDESRCESQLTSILLSVIELDAYIHDRWSGVYPHAGDPTARHGFKYDSRFMEAVDKTVPLEDGDLVGLVVSPALMRLGNETGDGFKNEPVNLIKSRVYPQRFFASTVKTSRWG